VEKLQCICNYFRRVCKDMPTGVLTFQRRYINPKDLPKWEICDLKFSSMKLHVSSAGKIETHGDGMLQVDFANKFVGGGVLGHGCVQEEIRFIICPELIVSRLFTEALKPQEALLMYGAEQFNSYSGYAQNFEWAGDFVDQTPWDDYRRKKTSIVAIDALMFRSKGDQYSETMMTRELNKAYVGFRHELLAKAPAVASGNWGCGAFGGEATLKSLIQLMVCCYCGRDLAYFTFGDDELRDQIYEMYSFLKDKEVTVGEYQ
jgi:poly(ADP-ribose) glycohydrolase